MFLKKFLVLKFDCCCYKIWLKILNNVVKKVLLLKIRCNMLEVFLPRGQIFLPQYFFTLKIIFRQTNFLTPNNFYTPIIFLRQNKFYTPKIFLTAIIFLRQKTNFFTPKNEFFYAKKRIFLRQKTNFFTPKNEFV